MLSEALTEGRTKTRWVYSFGGGGADGDASMKNLLGGKGANLAEMSALGLPVPPGFTITTEACTHYYKNERSYPAELKDQVRAALAKVEDLTGKNYRDHPHADRARWWGSNRDMDLLYAAFAAYDREAK